MVNRNLSSFFAILTANKWLLEADGALVGSFYVILYIYRVTDLTRKQQQITDFILKWQRTKGTTPTYQEIADQFGFHRVNAVTGHVRPLRRKRYLESEPGKGAGFSVLVLLKKIGVTHP